MNGIPYEFELNLGLAGGGPGVVKKHLKKNDAIEQVNSKTKAGIAKDLKSESEKPEAPVILAEFTKKVNDRINFLRTLGVGSDTNIECALEIFSDEKLQMLKEVLEIKSGMLPEFKLQKLGFIFLEELNMMEVCENYIAHKRLEILNAFVDAYGREFIAQKNGQYVYCHDKLLIEVIAVQNTRKTIARLARAPGGGSSSSEAASAPPPDVTSRCLIC